jgi:hypothetical protein
MDEIEKLRARKYQIIGVIQGLQKQTRLIDKQIKELLKNEDNQNPTDIS